jgi:Ni/Co efflux regulator RcnB
MTKLIVCLLAVVTVAPIPVAKAQTASAAERMQQPGPEETRLKRRAGRWDVTSRLRLTPETDVIVSQGLRAERTMVGLYLQEVMRPAAGSTSADFQRLAYEYYSRVEGRWQYVSMDTRFPVGIMPAWSFDSGAEKTRTFVFEGLAFVGLGRDVEGRMVRSNLEIEIVSTDHEFARQYWVQADGTGRRWLAVEYEYTRSR